MLLGVWLGDSSLLLGGAGAGGLFLLFWLCAWTVGGAFAIAGFLWMVTGYERIEISSSKILISRNIPIWARRVECNFADAAHLRVVEDATAQRINQLPNWYSRKSGTLQLDYGVHSLGFGLDLDPAEAKRLAHTILSVFPQLGPQGPNAGA
ncbi:hypothetical protein [Roseobacter sp.]|uniref:hypothetical protein n=1 Tax=Roseobacter sp. TaxID=1907202 RepID=UPI003296FC60